MKLEESNRLIAEFMGMKSIYTGGNVADYEWINTPKGLRWDFDSPPPFHRSWEWLMEVVIKCETICSDKINSLPNLPGLDNHGNWRAWSYHTPDLTSDIEMTYKAVVDFIVWFNAGLAQKRED